jgi:hypothetical protein
MGNYNPNAPIILGEEWVPIRDENLELSPATNFIETGHEFTLTASRVLQEGRYYVNNIPKSGDNGQHLGFAVYPAGTEAQSGPIRSVIIPVNNASVTGGSVSGAASATAALLSPTDGSIFFDADSAPTMGVRMGFAVGQYPELNGKRILGVNVLHVVTGDDSLVGPGVDGATQMLMSTEFSATPSVNFAIYDRLHSSPTSDIVRVPLGEINPFWTATSPTATADRMHWLYSQLQRLDTTTPWLFITMATGTGINSGAPVGTSMLIRYVALEVFFCEETRVAFGAVQLGITGAVALGRDSVYGANAVTLRTMAYAANPVLNSGDYTVVATSPFVGTQNVGFSAASNYPLLNAERQLYEIPSHPGVQVNLPFPMDDTALGRTLTRENIQVLPQISLHTSGGVMIEPHVYGRMAIAQVYGSITAIQEIDESLTSGVSYSYPWVRFYARRFGDTTVPLTLTGAAGLSGSSVSITPTEFDTLTEIIDGWKEVTLRFTVPPSMGTFVGIPGWTWSAVAETAGNRWEVLGACAPALSGIAGNLFNLAVPPSSQLGPATYGAGSNQTIAYVSTGVATHANNASVVPGMPASIQRGDLLLIFAAIRNSGTGVPDTPAGYTRIVGWAAGDCTQLFGKIYDGSETAPTITFTGGVANAATSAQMAAFRNVTFSVVVTGSTTNASQANIDYPALAASAMENDTLVLFLGWRQQDWTSVATIAGATEIGDAPTGQGDNQGIVWDFIVRGAAAAVGSGQFVVTGGVNAIGRGTTLALRHASPGSEVELTWMPQGVGSPYVTSPSADATSDGVLIFSQDQPTVSGFAVSTLTQAVSGIGQECGLDPCCIPTGIFYNRLTWTPLTNPSVPEWFYELQRMDGLDTGWHTIMMAGPSVSGFSDYEARVGVPSSYQIRQINSYGFYGLWSTTVAATVTSPGITGGCVTEGHILVFTTNEVQDGSSNLAYSSVWEGRVEESFSFAEAGFTTLQAMYDRDFFVAFRPLERGGEQFSREVLVQAAAISPPTLGDFRSLRDLAWDTVPYVCVRDEDGNRWLASVTVPSGRVVHYRRIYRAQVGIVEVTDTPSQVIL